jgi:hypothetical protein
MTMTLKLTAADAAHNSETQTPAIGHNSQGFGEDMDFEQLLAPDGLRMYLESEHSALLTKTKRLHEAFARWSVDSATITSADLAAKSTDFGKQLKEQAKKIEDNRKIVKSPFLVASETVERFFRAQSDPLNAAAKTIEQAIGKFVNAEAAKARKLAAEKAEEERREADRLAEMAAETLSTDMIEEAVVADQDAKRAEKVADQGISAFSQTRGQFAMSSASTRYVFEVADLAAVPREYLILDEAKIKRAINGQDRVEAIAGLTITEETVTRIR